MKNLHFTIDIKAPKEKVWDTLWGDQTYPQWTSVFSEGSRAITDWQEGSKVLFVDGSGAGMVSMIARSIPHEFMSFKHLGEAKDGEEQFPNEETNKWSGAMENYTLRETGAITQLTVDMDSTDDHEDMFQESFPKALGKVKEIAEK